MRFHAAIDDFIRDRRAGGWINSHNTETAYRHVLALHAQDVDNRDPRTIGRDDVKNTLRRWTARNTLAHRRSILISFYDWTIEEGLRTTNPARATPKVKTQQPKVYRLTRGEALRLIQAATGERQQRIAHLGLLAGMRRAELCQAQGKHFHRDGLIEVIGKGDKLRLVPVMADLQPIVADIRSSTGDEEYVLRRAPRVYPYGKVRRVPEALTPVSTTIVHRDVKAMADAAGISGNVTAHSMRHWFAEHITNTVGIHMARAILGHASIQTTQGYAGEVSPDQLLAVAEHISFTATTTEKG